MPDLSAVVLSTQTGDERSLCLLIRDPSEGMERYGNAGFVCVCVCMHTCLHVWCVTACMYVKELEGTVCHVSATCFNNHGSIEAHAENSTWPPNWTFIES